MKLTKTAKIVALCVALLAVVYGLMRTGRLQGQGLGTLGVFLLCPLMHLVMMLFMGHGHHGGKHDEEGHHCAPEDGRRASGSANSNS